MPKVTARYRTLFFDGQEDSKKAIELLDTNRVRFSKASISETSKEFPKQKLPCLITDQGEWRGLEAIQRYVKNAQTWGEI